MSLNHEPKHTSESSWLLWASVWFDAPLGALMMALYMDDTWLMINMV